MNRASGILTTWKQDKGFGFIRPRDGTPDVFVHIRDFGNVRHQPKVGDIVRYHATRDSTGKWRAADVHIDGSPRIPAPPRKRKAPGRKSAPSARLVDVLKGLVAGGLIIAAIAWFNTAQLTGKLKETFRAAPHETHAVPAGQFKCEGKQRCSQMSSCEEAMFYLRSCPNTKMDGDLDGIPCERQWCN